MALDEITHRRLFNACEIIRRVCSARDWEDKEIDPFHQKIREAVVLVRGPKSRMPDDRRFLAELSECTSYLEEKFSQFLNFFMRSMGSMGLGEKESSRVFLAHLEGIYDKELWSKFFFRPSRMSCSVRPQDDEIISAVVFLGRELKFLKAILRFREQLFQKKLESDLGAERVQALVSRGQSARNRDGWLVVGRASRGRSAEIETEPTTRTHSAPPPRMRN